MSELFEGKKLKPADVAMEAGWKAALQDEFCKPYFHQLIAFVKSEYRSPRQQIYPPGKLIFSAFDLAPFDSVRVVILGQDPYHGPGQAHGLCFSVPEGVPKPPSLRNILKELSDDLGIAEPPRGNLESWARQGVLLLNATLTVRAGQAGSHQGKGWETFTDAVIQKLGSEKENVVFLLWGAYARAKTRLLDPARCCMLEAAHPSPLAASKGFFGCRHFSQANAFLESKGLPPVDWRL